MKKLITLTLILALLTLQALTYESGPPDGHTNAPGEANCTACHSGTALQTSGTTWNSMTLTSSVSLGSFLPNTTYAINLSFADGTRDKYGFQVVALPNGASSSSSSIGTFSAPNTHVQIQTASGRIYVNHTSAGTDATGNSKTWTFNWTTPTSFSGGVTFYAVVNSTNGNSSSNGDVVYAKTFSANVLPVTWLSHEVQRLNENGAELTWSTATEINNHGFYIEKSTNAAHWSTISFISGAGNTRSVQYYRYTDNDAGKGLTYYRIRQEDFDGTSDYSPILTVQDANNQNAPVVLWNNNTLKLLNATEQAGYNVSIYSLSGECVHNQMIYPENPEAVLHHLKPGIYVVNARGYGEAAYRKICVN
jgi:hypothetical protein